MSMLPDALQIPYDKIVTASIDDSGSLSIEQITDILENEWHVTYCDTSNHSTCILSIPYQGCIFLYDQTSANSCDVDDRLIAAYGWSVQNQKKRDASRIRGFLGGRIEIAGKGTFDKGHALSHAMGGGLDINLFPQRPDLNRGRSEAGKLYRRMERYAADHPGTFVFSRLLYNDKSWVPFLLEYGVLMPDGKLWVELFEN